MAPPKTRARREAGDGAASAAAPRASPPLRAPRGAAPPPPTPAEPSPLSTPRFLHCAACDAWMLGREGD
jgi:hypothetical protein